MIQKTKHHDKSEVIRKAAGREVDFLVSIGIPAESLDGNHHPCPKCGGKDRFRYDTEKRFVICNQCFSHGNGDFLSAAQWWNDCTFGAAINLAGEYFNVSPSQPVKRHKPTPKKNATPFADQVQFLELDQDKLNSWVKHKPPATAEAAQSAGVRLGLWPKNAPQSKRFECVAFPAYRESNAPTAWILYRLDGSNFPAIPNGVSERKTHLLRGSTDGWVLFGGRSAVESAHTIIKTEGIPDALSIYSRLPDGHAVITNVCGAKGAAKCL